jgi:hypothetical protein
LHDSLSRGASHGAPVPTECVTIVRRRPFVPPPQEFVQGPHGPHAVWTQSTGHVCLLHDSTIRTYFGNSQSYCELPIRTTERDREYVPPPQATEHGEKVLHEVNVQSNASQGSAEHGSASCHKVMPSAAQLLPPLAFWTATSRVRVLRPMPHVAEHCDHAVHLVGRQSTGQGVSLQATVTLCTPHCAPPYAPSRST